MNRPGTVRRITTSLALAIGLVSSMTALPGGADFVSDAYSAIGTVANPHASFDGQPPVAGEVDAFTLNPVDFAGQVAQRCFDDATGDLMIYTTPGTAFYYKDPVTEAYARADYDTVVASGQQIRVVGRAYFRADGTQRCLATLVYNPPNTPRSGSAYSVKCGSDTDLRFNGFTVLATVVNKTIHYPCLKAAGDPLGVRLADFAEPPTFAVSEAIDDFGAKLEVHMSPTAKYVLGNRRATYTEVVKAGRQVRVFGNYQYIGGAWLFEARSVFYPDRNCVQDPDTGQCERQVAAFTPSVQQDAMSPGHYAGQITGGAPVFGNGSYQADLVWTAITDELGRPQWSVSGTWSITSLDQRTSLNGTVSGFTSGAAGISLSYDVDGGTGQFYNADGGGELEGGYREGLAADGPPANYYGNNRFVIIPNP